LKARTDSGTEVNVWRPHKDLAEAQSYWCHGHATQSHELHGYSIFGGKDMEAVLRDEWTQIKKKPLPGDIIVFRIDYEREITHTARVETVVHRLGNSTVMTLSSKNGFEPLQNGLTADEVADHYQAWWRELDAGRGGCCGCFATNVKQYYRRNQ
jgi:hypothetical protein